MRTLLLTTVAAVALAVPTVAAAHIPFKDGSGSAKRMASHLNKRADFVDVSCRYASAHVRCRGLYREKPRSDVYYRFTASFHKSAPKKGFYRQ